MLWEGKPLREVRADEIRALVQSGLTEHLQLDYKSALYEDGDRGRREFLLDICMFANANGGILLLGIPEQRGEDEQPTGVPDAAGVLGLEIGNPQAVLAAYDARVMEAIEERLSIESTCIDMGEERSVLAIRVPNSTNKPHSVRHQGHIYFPSRRERQRYHLTVREIKELVMRTASHLQQAEELLKAEFDKTPQPPPEPHLIIGMIPVFFEDFQIDVRNENVRMAVGRFSRAGGGEIINPTYSFDGIERRQNRFGYTVRLQRNGLLSSAQHLPRIPREGAGHQIAATTIDQLLRQFVLSASAVYDASNVGPPYVLGMMISLSAALTGGLRGTRWLR